MPRAKPMATDPGRSAPHQPATGAPMRFGEQCASVLHISEDFRADVRNYCPRCQGEAAPCLAEVVLRRANRRLV